MSLRLRHVGWLHVALAAALLLSVSFAGVAGAASLDTAPATTHAVSATGSLTFSPVTLRIRVGDTVVWTNTATSIPHTVTSNTGDPVSFNSGNLNPGQTFTVKFNTAGTYRYHCQYHVSLGMKGTIIVH